jgi:hypothetical protein
VVQRRNKKSSRKRLKHILTELFFDADSEYIIRFDTDRNLLIEIPVRKAKTDDSRKVCLGISQVVNVSVFGKCMIL